MATQKVRKPVAKPVETKVLPARRQRADGLRSRQAILKAAAKLATVRGLEGLSIGALAEHLGMSKSGLFAHFGSKEELELATIEAAEQIFAEEVVQPVLAAPPGLARLSAAADCFLSHVKREVFPGGCFFASVASELDTRPGRPRDRVCKATEGWMALLEGCITEAKGLREVRADTDVAQTAFEFESLLLGANCWFVLTGDAAYLKRAQTGILHLTDRIRA